MAAAGVRSGCPSSSRCGRMASSTAGTSSTTTTSPSSRSRLQITPSTQSRYLWLYECALQFFFKQKFEYNYSWTHSTRKTFVWLNRVWQLTVCHPIISWTTIGFLPCNVLTRWPAESKYVSPQAWPLRENGSSGGGRWVHSCWHIQWQPPGQQQDRAGKHKWHVREVDERF